MNESPRQLIFSLAIPNFRSTKNQRGKLKESVLPAVPSWNDILSMEPWGINKRKKEIEDAFLCALRASAQADCSTKTTFAKSSWSIAADTLACYQMTRQQRRTLKLRNARLLRAKKGTPS